MPITMLYAGALSLVLLVLAVRVIQARGATKVFMGDGGNDLMIRRMRGQANFIEYVPMILILMGLLERDGVAPWVLHALGGALLAGRLAHAYAFGFAQNSPPARFLGAVLSTATLGVAALLALWRGFASL